MYAFLSKRGQLIAFALGALITLIFIIGAVTGLPEGFDTMKAEEQHKVGVFNFGISASIALIIIAAAAMLLFGIYHVFTNLKGSMKAIIGFVALVLLYFIARSASSAACADVSEGVCKAVGGGITVALVLVAVAFVGFLLAELINLFK